MRIFRKTNFLLPVSRSGYLSVCISEVGVIACAFNLIRRLRFIGHQTEETATEGQSWTLSATWGPPHPLLYDEEFAHLLTILWTSVLPSFFGWSGLCGGDKLNQSQLGGLLSGGTSSPNNGSSSRSLKEAEKVDVRHSNQWSLLFSTVRASALCHPF